MYSAGFFRNTAVDAESNTPPALGEVVGILTNVPEIAERSDGVVTRCASYMYHRTKNCQQK